MLFFFFLKKENETNSNESTVRPSFSNRFLSRASSVFLLPGLLLISSWFYGILLKLLKLPNFIFSLIKHTSSHPRLRILLYAPLAFPDHPLHPQPPFCSNSLSISQGCCQYHSFLIKVSSQSSADFTFSEHPMDQPHR